MIVSTGIVPSPPIHGGAIESHTYSIASALADRGAEVHYVGDVRKGIKLHSKVTYHPVHSPIKKFPVPFPGWILSHLIGGSLCAKVSYDLTLHKKADIAHFHEETSALLYLRLRPNRPTVFTLHNPPSWLGTLSSGREAYVRRAIGALTGRQVIAKSDHFVALSDFVASEFIRWLGLDKDQVSVIKHPIDTDFFRPDRKSQMFATERFHLTEPYIIFVGRLDRRKGIGDLLRAVKAMPSPVNTVIVGDGPQKNELVSLSEELGIQSTVRFLGAVTPDLLPGLLGAARCMVLPSSLEMSSLAAIESLACGTPVVATELPVLIGTIEDGFNGLLVPHQPDPLANAISKLVTDNRLRSRLGDNARKKVLEDNSQQVVADQLLHVYAQVSHN